MGLQRVGYNLATEQEEAIQWLRLCASNARDRLQSLVGELRSHRLCSKAKKLYIKKRILPAPACCLPTPGCTACVWGGCVWGGRGTFCRGRRFFHTLTRSHAPRSVTGELAARRSLQHGRIPGRASRLLGYPLPLGGGGDRDSPWGGGGRKKTREEDRVWGGGGGRLATFRRLPPAPPASAQVGDGLKFHSKLENKKQSVVWIDS